METTENTTNTPTPDVPQAPVSTNTEVAASEASKTSEVPEVPGSIGKLTPEEQQALVKIRQETQQLLAKIGEHEVLKMRLLARVDDLDQQGQEHINTISQRIGITDGQQWVALQDGTIRLVNPPASGQNGEGATPPG